MINKKMKMIFTLFIIIIFISKSIQPVDAVTGLNAKIKAANTAIQELHKLGIDLNKSNKTNLDKTMMNKQAYELLADLQGTDNEDVTYANKTMSISVYLTEILNLLGYYIVDDNTKVSESHYISAINKSVELGLVSKNEYTTKSKLLRADAIVIFRRALELQHSCTYQSFKYMMTGNTKYWINTAGKGLDYRDGGVFYEEVFPACEEQELLKLDPDDSYSTNLMNLNHMIWWTYGYAYDSMGSVNKLWQDGQEPLFAIDPKHSAEITHVNSTDQYKVTVKLWRNSYYSDLLTNFQVNSILETFYFLTGDKEVAYALFSWIDDEVIHGYKDPKNFGFKEIKISGKSGTIEMNGIKIKFENTKTQNSYYFMNVANTKDYNTTSTESFDKAQDFNINSKIRYVKPASEDSYFKIQTTSNDSYYYIRSRTNSQLDYLSYQLLDSEYNTVANFKADANDGKLYIKLNPNSTYYLVASDNSGGPIESILYIEEIEDDISDTLEGAKQAKSFSINKTYTRILETKEDVDVIKFTTGAATDYTIHTRIWEEYDLDFTLYDENGNQVSYQQMPIRHMYMAVKLKPNKTYFLKVSGSSAVNLDYDFSIIASDAIKLNKSNVTITKGKSVTLHLESMIPADSIYGISWFVDRYDIAKTNYDSANAISTDKVTVTGLAKGKAVITCYITLKDGNYMSLKCNITVK